MSSRGIPETASTSGTRRSAGRRLQSARRTQRSCGMFWAS